MMKYFAQRAKSAYFFPFLFFPFLPFCSMSLFRLSAQSFLPLFDGLMEWKIRIKRSGIGKLRKKINVCISLPSIEWKKNICFSGRCFWRACATGFEGYSNREPNEYKKEFVLSKTFGTTTTTTKRNQRNSIVHTPNRLSTTVIHHTHPLSKYFIQTSNLRLSWNFRLWPHVHCACNVKVFSIHLWVFFSNKKKKELYSFLSFFILLQPNSSCFLVYYIRIYPIAHVILANK